MLFLLVFFCKQKAVYEVRISDGISDVGSSDLPRGRLELVEGDPVVRRGPVDDPQDRLARVERLLEVGGDQVEQVVRIQVGLGVRRSEARRVGKECVRKCISQWSSIQ